MVDLDRAFKDLDRLDTPVSWSQVANRQPGPPSDEPRRPRKVLVAVFAFAIAIAGMSLLVGGFVAPGRHPVLPTISGSPAPSATVVPPASMVGGSGLVEASGPSIIFCGGAFLDSLTPGPPACSEQVQVVGVDLSALSGRVKRNGVTWGSAYLAGSFSNGVLHVMEQGPPRPPDSRPYVGIEPPCPAPPAGWATYPTSEPATTPALDAYRRHFGGDITSFAWFHPRPQTWVGVIASTDPARTTAALAITYTGHLCVVRSRYRVSEVHAAKAAATALLMQHLYGMFAVGSTVGNDGQPVVEVGATLDTPELRQALASQPAGLIVIVPWLAPLLSQADSAEYGIVSGHLYAVGGMLTAPRPLSGSITMIGIGELKVSVGTDGAFSVSLRAGRYTLTGRSLLYNDGAGVCQATSQATVTAGQTISVDVLCQEK